MEPANDEEIELGVHISEPLEYAACRVFKALGEPAGTYPADYEHVVQAALGWEPMDTAPSDRRVLVNFKGAGPIVAYRDPEYPEMWVRYLGYGKSTNWPTVHEDYATAWMDVFEPPTVVRKCPDCGGPVDEGHACG